MTEDQKDNATVRAWLLVYAQAPDLATLAANIIADINNKYKSSGQGEMRRADVTDGPFNLVIPVIANDTALLQEIIESILAFEDVQQLLVARVTKHIQGPDDIVPLGDNAWG